jgi:hypothetical protein
MLFYLVPLLCVMAAKAYPIKAGFDKSAFYAAMASEKISDINEQLVLVRSSSFNEKEAYEGALLMKKAGLVEKAKEKLSLFKSGRIKLEAAIKREGSNAEYSFLRLIIQEHAPKIVKYRDDLDADATLVRSNYRNLPPVVQKAIAEYSKKSKFLKPLQP